MLSQGAFDGDVCQYTVRVEWTGLNVPTSSVFQPPAIDTGLPPTYFLTGVESGAGAYVSLC